MFSLIKELHQQLGGTYVLSDQDDLEERGKLVQETVQLYAKTLSRKFKIKTYMCTSPLSIGPSSVSQKSYKGAIYLPALCFLENDEIPENLRFAGPQDPKLNRKRNVQLFSNWIADATPLRRSSVDRTDKIYLKIFLKLSERPEKAKEALLFAFAHELGHIRRHDSAKTFKLSRTMECINIFTLGIFKFLAEIRFYHSVERKADRFACTRSQEAVQGGLYYNKSIRKIYRAARKESLYFWFATLPKGTIWLPAFSKYHPSETSRIKYMRKRKIRSAGDYLKA